MPAKPYQDNAPTLWVEEGEPRMGPVATVAPIAPIDREYTFAVPDHLAGQLAPGQRVVVPMGRARRPMKAFCLDIHVGEWSSTLQPIESCIDPVSHLTGPLLELGRWMARHYACPLGRTLNALVPAAVHRRSGFRTVRRARLARLLEEIIAEHARLGPRQRSLLETLAGHRQPVEVGGLLERSGASAATLREAARRGWVEVSSERVPPPAPTWDVPRSEPDFELTAEQRAALDEVRAMIAAARFRVGLLFGVSGSGKTEVYVRAIRRVVEAGRQAILLVPEIALTTQLVNRLARRFDDVAVIHSGLTDVERSLTWVEIAAGQRKVVIGTRSAVFAPCPNLGLMVVDEEQETSYKNLQSPRFGVRDVAVKRGQIENLPVLLGSATPSLESWFNSERAEHYRRIEITRRVRDLPMPAVHVVDMRQEHLLAGRSILVSHLLADKLADTLARGEQAVVLINRRGFASGLFCPSCKRWIECPSCNVPMVLHTALGAVICHHCGRRERPPDLCPDPACDRLLVAVGMGTQRVEDQFARRFPDKRIVRVDSDTMRTTQAYRQVIDEFEARRIDVLVGTQMIAKGLDFPHVSFVGVIGADAAVAAADFRAGERLFQLITQVAGRAGRSGGRGEVVVQSEHPEAPALQAAILHDYRAFVGPELEIRRDQGFPPFGRLTRIVLAHAREETVRAEAAALADRIRRSITDAALPEASVLGPTPCLLARVRDRYRYDLLIRTSSPGAMQALLDRLREQRGLRTGAQSLVVDVDPVSMA